MGGRVGFREEEILLFNVACLNLYWWSTAAAVFFIAQKRGAGIFSQVGFSLENISG